MKVEQWKSLSRAARHENESPILALIVDSPWIPDYYGIDHLDYYVYPEIWTESNLELYERFEEIIFVPGFWVEYGMAAEPSGFGSRVTWPSDSTPVPHAVDADLEVLIDNGPPNPEKDGLMAWVLKRYEDLEEELAGTSHRVKMVATRGPLAIASWIRGVEGLLLDIKKTPDQAKDLIEITTRTAISRLEAQINVLSEVDGILLLDDIVGFFSPEDYREFCEPYLQRIFTRFDDKLRIYHNDSEVGGILGEMAELDMDVFNFSHKLDFNAVREASSGRWALMGNIPPVEVLTRGSREEVISAVDDLLESLQDTSGVILSAGGGVAPDTPVENVEAMLEGFRKYA